MVVNWLAESVYDQHTKATSSDSNVNAANFNPYFAVVEELDGDQPKVAFSRLRECYSTGLLQKHHCENDWKEVCAIYCVLFHFTHLLPLAGKALYHSGSRF